MSDIKHSVLRVAAGISPFGEAELEVAAELVFAPESLLLFQPIVLFCLPGGGMTRRFFDLQADGDNSYSFAEQMAERGFIVVVSDHPGVGESSGPADLFLLSPDILARAHATAVEKILEILKAGKADPTLPVLSDPVSIGVGHSMGAMLSVFQQAHYRQHKALVLLGYGVRGLPEMLTEEGYRLAGDRTAIDRSLERLARLHFGGVPPPEMPPELRKKISGARAEPKGVEAMKRAYGELLPTCVYFSLIPQSHVQELKRIDVPVFLGNGDFDFVGPPHELLANFPASSDITLIVLKECNHSLFMFPSRFKLFERLRHWIEGLAE